MRIRPLHVHAAPFPEVQEMHSNPYRPADPPGHKRFRPQNRKRKRRYPKKFPTGCHRGRGLISDDNRSCGQCSCLQKKMTIIRSDLNASHLKPLQIVDIAEWKTSLASPIVSPFLLSEFGIQHLPLKFGLRGRSKVRGQLQLYLTTHCSQLRFDEKPETNSNNCAREPVGGDDLSSIII
jgi:hypothetical protein